MMWIELRVLLDQLLGLFWLWESSSNQISRNFWDFLGFHVVMPQKWQPDAKIVVVAVAVAAVAGVFYAVNKLSKSGSA